MAISTERLSIPEIEQVSWAKPRRLAWADWTRQKIISDVFRLTAFGAAILQMAAFPVGPGYDASQLPISLTRMRDFANGPGYEAANLGIVVLLGAIYTVLKIAQPFKWQQVRSVNVFLLSVDVLVCVLLVNFTGGIHSPFILYTLLPVLTASLLKDYMVTVSVAIITAAYVLTGNIYNSYSNYMLNLQAVNDFFVYSVALGLVAVLPYSINLTAMRRLRSNAAQEERLSISRDLHDSVCQALYGLRWQVQHLSQGERVDEHLAEKLKNIETAANLAERDARELLGVLHSSETATPFILSIKRFLEQLRRDTGIDFELDCDDADFQLGESAERQLLMICVEALTNIRKHAGARKVSLSCRMVGSRVRIKITDDGYGFDESDAATRSGYGLTVMHERAASIGATLRIVSARGKGTEVEITVPAGEGRK